MLKAKNVLLFSILITFMLSLSGCVYYRLFTLKQQLAEFDKYIEIIDDGDLVLSFAKPVLYSKDVLWLTGLKPTLTKGRGYNMNWEWEFEKLYAAGDYEENDFAIIFSTLFINDRLTQFVIPENFQIILPKEFIIAIIRSFGNAEINKEKRSVSSKISFLPQNITILAKKDVELLLGKPFTVKQLDGEYIYVYKYKLRNEEIETERKRLAWVEFRFVKDNDELKEIKSAFFGTKINLTINDNRS